MIARTHTVKLLLFSAAAAATIVACGGDSSSSKTPGASETARTATSQAATTARAGQTVTAGGTSQPAGTAGAANKTTPATTGASVVPGASTQVIPPNVTVLPNGTATNPEGTPVELPTAAAAATLGAGATPGSTAAATPGAQATSGASGGTTISIEPPADASGDFDVTIRIDGVTKPYRAFNVYITFDPAILSALVIKPGTALSESPDQTFCARAPATTGAVGLGCTVIQGPSTATNGVLATIRFRQVGAGTTQLHLTTVAEGGALTGSYTSTPQQGAQAVPDIVTLVDGSVTLP